MFTKNFEEQLAAWKTFRESLETTEEPFRQVLDFYKRASLTRISCDPWNQSTWASPWELLEENQYCEFGVVLGMCYSLQLTDRFSGSAFEIHICTNNEKSETHYLLFVDNQVINYNNQVVSREELPDALFSQRVYEMPSLQ
jgi:hypothetical protein